MAKKPRKPRSRTTSRLQASSADIAMATSITSQLEEAAGTLKAFIKRTSPRSLLDKIDLALQNANGKSDIIQDIIRTKRMFYSAGYAATFSRGGKEMKPKFIDGVNSFFLKHNVQKLAQDLTFDFTACQNCILLWNVQGGEIKYVQRLDIMAVEWDKSAGNALLTVKIPEEVRSKIKNAVDRLKIPEAELYDTYSPKLVEAVMANKPLELKPEDGDYWIIHSDGPQFGGLVEPTQKAVFGDAVLMDLLAAGDFSMAFFLKACILHATQGESIQAGPKAGSKEYWMKNEDRIKIQNALKKLAKTMLLVTDHTVKLNYVFPDTKAFDPAKYLKCEERILRWGNVSSQLLTGSGDGFAQGSLGGKRFAADGVEVRKHIGWVLASFLTHESIRSALGTQEGDVVAIGWDWHNLKEWKQALDEIKSAYDRGLMSIESFQERIGLVMAVEKRRKQNEQKDRELWQPLFEPKQGMLTDNEGGRPNEGKETPPEGVRPSRGQ